MIFQIIFNLPDNIEQCTTFPIIYELQPEMDSQSSAHFIFPIE